jgi:hypothetical protein
MAKQTERDFTHVRIRKTDNKRLLKVARTRGAKENKEIPIAAVLGEILERELPKEEKKLGI